LRYYIRKILIWGNILFALALVLSNLANFVNPAHIWQLAFFGLGFPVFLIINLGFVVFWLYRRNWLFLLSFIIILSGYDNVARFLEIKIINRTVNPNKSIKLISFNVRMFNQYNWLNYPSVRDSILNFVISEQPDVVFFQDYYTNETVLYKAADI
jgi:hypothetical protein